jgi:hypothetical protein
MELSGKLYAPAGLTTGNSYRCPLTGRWVGIITSLDSLKKREISCSWRKAKHECSVTQRASHLTNHTLPPDTQVANLQHIIIIIIII